MTGTPSGRVAAILVNDRDIAAGLRRVRSVDAEVAAFVDSVFLAARARARRFAAGIQHPPTAASGGNPHTPRPSFAHSLLMSSVQVAQCVGKAPRTVRDDIQAGRLFATKVCGRWMSPLDAVAIYAAACAEGRRAA